MTTPALTEPSALLFGDNHRRLLGLLLMRPDQSFHVREIARLTGLDAGNTHKSLKRMERAGLVTHERIGNLVRYQADSTCPIFEELAGIIRKTTGMADTLREALIPLADRITVAFVFGSIAKGEQGPHSDIDLMVVGQVPFEDVVQAVHAAHASLGREVNPVVMSEKDFANKRKAKERFVARIMAEPKIVLMGAFDES
jgi:predicted nucleotidyltransferase